MRASATVSKTGRLRWVEPPLPGEVPPTIFVPYAIACSEWKVPFLPVKPWQMTLVFLSMRMDMSPQGVGHRRRRTLGVPPPPERGRVGVGGAEGWVGVAEGRVGVAG